MKQLLILASLALAGCSEIDCETYTRIVARYDACLVEPKCRFSAEEYYRYEHYTELRNRFCARVSNKITY